MGYRNKLKKILSVSVVLSVFGFFLSDPKILEICRLHKWCDSYIVGELIGVPSLFFFVPLSIISLILLFRPEHIFRSWFRFAKYYLVIALILIVTASESGGGLFAGGLSSGFDREGMIWFTSGLFLLISLIMILTKSFIPSRKN